MATQQLANLASSVLASGYTAGNTSITLNTGDGAKFPSTGNFTIALNDPPDFFLLCTARSTDVLTVSSSGTEGTTAINEASGVAVTHVITAGVTRALYSDYSVSDILANLPSAGLAGRIFIPQNGMYDILRDNGSSWNYFRNGRLCMPPDVSWTFSWVNQGDATLDTSHGASILYGGSASGTDSRTRVKSAPSTPYHALIGYKFKTANASNCMIGMCFRDSGSGKMNIFGIFQADLLRYVGFSLSSPTGFDATFYNPGDSFVIQGDTYWMRIGDDGTNRTYSVSENGYDWLQLYSEANSTYFTANQVGFYVNGGASLSSIDVFTYEETS
jgi:hypothetical protein